MYILQISTKNLNKQNTDNQNNAANKSFLQVTKTNYQ